MHLDFSLSPSSLQLSTYCCNALVESTAVRKKIPVSMNYLKANIFHGLFKNIDIALNFWQNLQFGLSSQISSWTDLQQQGVFWESCDWNYLCFPGSPYRHAVYATSIRSGLHYELKRICDYARNPASLIACSSSATTSFVASPSGRVLPQIRHSFSGLSLLILLSVFIHCCISRVEGLAFLCFGTWKRTVNREQ